MLFICCSRIADFQRDFKEAVEREARADLVEKRKAADTFLFKVEINNTLFFQSIFS